MMKKVRKHTLPKLSLRELKDWDYDIIGTAFCLRCDSEFEVKEVVENPRGDWCPTEGCDGGGWGVDLFAEPWWRSREQTEEIFEDRPYSLR